MERKNCRVGAARLRDVFIRRDTEQLIVGIIYGAGNSGGQLAAGKTVSHARPLTVKIVAVVKVGRGEGAP